MTDQVTNWLAGNYTVGGTTQNCYFPVPYYPVPSLPPAPQVTPVVISVPTQTPLSLFDLEQIRAIVREEVHKALHGREEEKSEPERAND